MPSWQQSEIFPIIAHTIENLYRQEQRFVTAREIGVGLLADAEGRNRNSEKCKSLKHSKSSKR